MREGASRGRNALPNRPGEDLHVSCGVSSPLASGPSRALERVGLDCYRFVKALRDASSRDIATMLAEDESTLEWMTRGVSGKFKTHLKEFSPEIPEPAPPSLSTDDVRDLFGNIEQLLHISKNMLSQLRPIIEVSRTRARTQAYTHARIRTQSHTRACACATHNHARVRTHTRTCAPSALPLRAGMVRDGEARPRLHRARAILSCVQGLRSRARRDAPRLRTPAERHAACRLPLRTPRTAWQHKAWLGLEATRSHAQPRAATRSHAQPRAAPPLWRFFLTRLAPVGCAACRWAAASLISLMLLAMPPWLCFQDCGRHATRSSPGLQHALCGKAAGNRTGPRS
jgi:hypothetical protein